MASKVIKLLSGSEMPVLGFGTFLSEPGKVEVAVLEALRTGYRHIDCARVYNNEKEVGAALKEAFESGVVKREDVFITSKVAAGMMGSSAEVGLSLRQTLDDLSVEYLDLLLIHQPISVQGDFPACQPRRSGFGMQDIWRSLEALHAVGLVRNLGVSNFQAQMLNDVLEYSVVKPAVNQIERHPHLQQNKFVEWARQQGVYTTAYAPLGAPQVVAMRGVEIEPLLSSEVIVRIAKKHSKTPAQVLIRWNYAQDVFVIPKSVTPSRIKENFDIFDFELDCEDMKAIAELDCNGRVFDQEWTGVPVFH
eukprot:CAMPEP_0119133484 /NCGR_PEP_ID=MMETSP1310-20130426/13398_1 /TAXON_ID=464262 /ORGANISM="Genus nov. species nov., Strain RCC2339" /LENGTH=305 /DNA_ID=CAMNT_0007124177 /DNA_START=84 /DNA_END=1001 /DNA_ORIENTATION=-